MTARSFVWLALGGGAWSLGSNWADITDGTSPALFPPGAQDSVTVAGPTGAQVQTITGQGSVAAALFTGNTLLSGAFSAGTLSVGGVTAGGILQLGRGTSVQAGTAGIASGSMVVGPGGTLAVAGPLTLGSGGAGAAALNVTGGGAADVLSLLMTSGADSIYVDPASILELGSAGGASAGYLTVDAGASLAGQGNANQYGRVANNGTLTAAGGTLSVGALSGTGSLVIGAGATLALNGACGAGQSVSFAGTNATLAIDQEFFAPVGSISGFAAGDAFDIRGSLISAATYAGGVLTLSYGGQVAARLQLAGNYAGCVFLTAGDGAGGTLVTVSAGVDGGGGPSPGTPTPDLYAWVAGGSGQWNSAANWQDITTGATPAAVAPGVHNLVSIAADQNVFSVISGPANAAALALFGDVALAGTYAFGTLTVGQAGAGATPGTLDILAATRVAAQAASVADGAVSVAGSGATLSVAGTLTLGGGPQGVGLPTASLFATAGGSVRAGSLVMGGGSGASITTDPTGSIEIGSAGGAQAGAVTIDAGATLAGNGQVNPFGAIIDNGSILASQGTLTLGAVSGTGSLEIAAGATLELLSATAAPILLDGSAAAGISTLEFSSARAAPTGTLTGLAAGDVIHLEGSPLTSAQYTASGNGGTLLLIYGTNVVARIAIAGSLAGEHFIMTPDGANGTYVTLLTSGGGGGGGGGQSGTDQFAWARPVSGSWGLGANWIDLTTGAAVTQPPGTQTPVQIAGPGGVLFQSIGGTGVCASLALTGNTALSGSFTTGQLTVGQAATQTAPAVAGQLDIGPNTTLTAAQATLADGALLCIGAGAQISLSGTLALGGGPAGVGQPDTLLAAAGRGGIQLGGLTLGGGDSNAVTVDLGSSIEVGVAGGAAAGALTVDAGALASGNGTLNAAGLIIDNGAIQAQGGTLLVGAVCGSGTLGIGTEATLALGGADACPIAFLGGGATLLLPGSADLPTGAISGFAIGDSILSGSPVDAVSYTPRAGGIGTLSLSVAGQTIGSLLLAGNFAGDSFSVQPSGTGAAIILSAQVNNGPPSGTATPDSYQWTGGAGGQAWAAAGNWADLSQGPGPAAVAPGQNDTVAIAGGNGAVLTIAGPADAAGLSLSGTVALGGAYAVGTLGIGSNQAAGLLALGSGAAMEAASASVIGGLAVGGGTLWVDGLLTLGSTAAAVPAGVLAVSNQGRVRAGTLVLNGAGSVVATDATGSIEIGGSQGAAAGSVVVDASGVLQGQGSVLASQIVDQGTIIASGGTLVLGNVSGTGTLLAGVNADLVLQGSAGGGLTADFAGAGTLTMAGALSATPSIADFGAGDAILLPISGAATAVYAATAPGIGELSIEDAGGQILARLTLLGSQAGEVFTVAADAGGGTILTTQPDNTSGQGGQNLPYPNFTTGNLSAYDLENAVAAGFPYVSQADVTSMLGNPDTNPEVFLYYSTDGLPPSQTVFGGAGQPAGFNVEVVAPLAQQGGGSGPLGGIALQAGYSGIFLEGTEPLALTDAPFDPNTNSYVGLGHALLVGNEGNDSIAALGDGDTLVGGTGANTVFYAALQNNGHSSLPVDVYIQGGGNDLIATNQDNAAITTSGGNSTVFLGASNNSVVSNGSDTIICGSQYGDDTITALAGGGRSGDLVFSSGSGILDFIGGNAPSTVVGSGTTMVIQGNGGGGVVWGGGSDLTYIGGSGAGLIVAGSGHTSVQGGSGPVTVFGGTGPGVFSGGPGSIFVVGAGASTVTAGSGDGVYVIGAAAVSVTGGDGAQVFAGSSTGNDVFNATGGSETLWGGAGTDQFIAGSGPDLFVSGGGKDIFNFTNGVVAGIDAIVGFVPGQDTIALHGFGQQAPRIVNAFGGSVILLQNGAQIFVENTPNLTAQSLSLT